MARELSRRLPWSERVDALASDWNDRLPFRSAPLKQPFRFPPSVDIQRLYGCRRLWAQVGQPRVPGEVRFRDQQNGR